MSYIDFSCLGLDFSKKIFLYVFIFYLSLIECMSDSFFVYCEKFNIIIKLYFFSLFK